MAKVTITISDVDDGGVFVEWDGVPGRNERAANDQRKAALMGYREKSKALDFRIQEQTADIARARIQQVVREHPRGISARDLCAELRRRGWAFDNLTPATLGPNGDDILKEPE